jgi:replicative superfamily II helicase
MTFAAFGADYGFVLDDFQLAGIRALAEGRSTLVCAPTGAGKTVVGEFAVWQALQRAASASTRRRSRRCRTRSSTTSSPATARSGSAC